MKGKRQRAAERRELEGQLVGGLSVVKGADGRWRWIMLSSNSFEDRDKEIISQKALEADVARADSVGQYGPLRWWHVPGLEIGDCDFNAMHGRILVESGTFRDEGLGAVVAENANALSGSIGFLHPATDPDGEGVYHTIIRYERSTLPKAAAANPFVSLVVEQEEPTMLKEKIAQFKSLFGAGVDDSLIGNVIKLAEGTEQAALDKGIRTKEVEALDKEAPPIPPATEPPPAEPVPAEAATAKELSLDDKLDKVRDAVYALSPSYAGCMPQGYWVYADTVFEGHVIIREEVAGESHFWDAPFTQDPATLDVTLSTRDQWAEVQRAWQPVGTAVVAGKEKAPESVVPAAKAAAVPAAPAADATPKPEDKKIADMGMTLGDLTKLVTEMVDKKMAMSQAADTAATGKAASDLTVVKDQVTALDAKAKSLSEQVEILIGDAPRSVARAARASQDPKTAVDQQPADVKAKIKAEAEAAGPKPDSWVDPFMKGLQAAGGAGVESPLVLGGPTSKP